MKESLIVGTITKNIDDKNRICLPAEYDAKVENLYAILYEKYMSIYSENVIQSCFNLSEDDYSTIEILSVDKSRRMSLNEKLINMYKIKKELLLIGKNNHFDIVSYDNLNDYNKVKGNNKVLKNEYGVFLVRKED